MPALDDLTSVLSTALLKTTPSGPVQEFILDQPEGTPPAKFHVSSWALDPDLWTNWDQHQSLEIWLVAAGTGTVWRGEQATSVTAGQSVLMPSQVPHRLHNETAEPMKVFSIWWLPDADA